MVNLFTRSACLKKLCAGSAGGFVALCGLFWFTANLWAERKLPYIESTLGAALHRPITIQSAHYDLFGGFRLDGVEVKQFAPAFSPVHIERVRIQPSFELFPVPAIRVRRVVLEGPVVALQARPEGFFRPAVFLRSLSPNYGQIGALKIRLDLSSIEVKRGNLSFQKWLTLPPVKYSFKAELRDGKRITLRGTVGSAARFSVLGLVNEKKAVFPLLSVRVGAVEMRGRGEVDLSDPSGRYRFGLSSGKTAMNKFKGLPSFVIPDAGAVQLSAELTGDDGSFEPFAEATLYGAGLHDVRKKFIVTNTVGTVRLTARALELNRIWAFVNDLPVGLNGRVYFDGRPGFRFEATTYPGQLPGLRASNAFNASFAAAGKQLEDGWSGYARLRAQDYAHGGEREDIWTVSFHGLSRAPNENRSVCRSFRLRRQDASGAKASVDLSLSRLSCLFSADARAMGVEIMDAGFGGGRGRLKLGADLSGPVWELSAGMSGVDVEKLPRFIKHNYPVSGELDAHVDWKLSREDSRCSIRFDVADGSIGPSERLADWARQTGIEPLERIRFRSFSGDAVYESGLWHLKDLRLSGDAVRLAADLDIAEGRLAGKLSARFPAASIRDSSELKWLLWFVGGAEWVDFDFKVAGHLTAPRVQWLEGEFKKKVEMRLAPWMRSELARQIEKRLAENSAQVR